MNEATLTLSDEPNDAAALETLPPEDVAAANAEKAPEPEKEIPGPNPFEIRGYEVAKLRLNEWEQVQRYQPTMRGLGQAFKDAKWLSERHPRSGYTVRVLVSAPLPVPKEEPLRLEADEQPTKESE